MRLGFCVFLLSLILPSAAGAQFGVALGGEYGFGPLLRIGPAPVQFEIGGGIAPAFAITEVTRSGPFVSTSETSFHVYLPATVGAKLSLRLNAQDSENRVGLKLGATYNSLFGAGGGGGLDFQVDRNPTILISAGAMVFPEASDRLRKRIQEEESQPIQSFSAPLATFQPFISLTVLFGR